MNNIMSSAKIKDIDVSPLGKTVLSSTPHMQILFCKSGSLTVQSSFNELSINENEVCIASPYAEIEIEAFNSVANISIYSFLITSEELPYFDNFEILKMNSDSEIALNISKLLDLISDVSLPGQLLKNSIEYYMAYLAVSLMKSSEKKLSYKIIPAISYIKNNLNQKIEVSRLATECRMSESSLYKLFNSALSKSPKQYIREVRMNRAAYLLTETDKQISDISYEVGFYDQYCFSKEFKKDFGVPPSMYRKAK